ncbi:unnamed protein product [Mesocestoides corti]|uniref:BACK domain-containing protein n=1 Tax=Mesocestoides corti TaxID=53468 RepID=A0A0R3UQZ2_MESCO|nr:unnamed protein product [Mesocestoides corti]
MTAVTLHSRISRDNFGCIWSIGNATKNKDMIKLCVPVIAAHFDSIDSIQPNFYASTDLAILATVLTDSRLGDVMEDSKLLAVAKWFEARSTATEEEGEENGKTTVDIFMDLVAAIGLGKITGLSKDCLTAFIREENNLSIVTFEQMAGVPRIDASLRCSVSARCGCAVVALNGSIYLIGGDDETGVATNEVDTVNAFDGRVSSVAAMTQARWKCSAAANGQHLFVFGGFEKGSGALTSCEKFDPATNRQVCPTLLKEADSAVREVRFYPKNAYFCVTRWYMEEINHADLCLQVATVVHEYS